MSLSHLGWNARWEAVFVDHKVLGLEPMRVAREDRDRYTLLGEAGAIPGTLAGRLRHEARTRMELPAVGDWVAARRFPESATIVAVLPRVSAFVRKVAGQATDEQVVAANIDTAFLVSGLDGDLNLRRIERHLAAAWESGAQPVVVLNKTDLVHDLAARVAEVEAIAPGTPVVPLSALVGEGLGALAGWLGEGATVALIGSSGVGKSTLANALLGEERQATATVREADSRGRHTTTHRELVPLPQGALLLDTPGMRELQLWGDHEGLEGAFPDVAVLAGQCRFRDCSHASEPGCAVRAALADGTLDAERFASWTKLQRELRWLASRQDARLRAEETAKWKAIHQSMKDHPKASRWRRA